MAVRQMGVWGIDVGQCALKAVRLEVKDGQVVATAFEYIEHPKILSQPDADPDELLLLAEKIPDMIRKRVLQRPDAFRRIATLDDRRLDEVLEFLEKEGR